MPEQRKFVPINRRTGKPYTKKPKNLENADIGVLDSKGNLVRVYDIPVRELRTIIFELGESAYLKDYDKLVKRIKAGIERKRVYKTEMVFVDEQGYPFEGKIAAGTLGKWAIQDKKGDLWLLQLPGKLMGVEIEGLQRYAPSIKKWMDQTIQMSPDNEIIVPISRTGKVTIPHEQRFVSLLTFNRFGQILPIAERLPWAKYKKPDRVLILRKKSKIKLLQKTQWFALDYEQSVRESIGNLAVDIPSSIIKKVRKKKGASFELDVRVKVLDWSNNDRNVLTTSVSLGKTASQIWKDASMTIVRLIGSVGFRWTTLTRLIEGDDLDKDRSPEALEAQFSRKYNVRTDLMGSTSDSRYLASLGKISAGDVEVPLSELRQATEVYVQLELKTRGV